MGLRLGSFDMTDIVGGVAAPDAPIHFPFEISTSTDKEGNLSGTVRPGTVNSLLPENVFDSFPVDDDVFVNLKCQTNGQTPTSIEITFDSEPQSNQQAAPNAAPPVFYVPIGIISVDTDENGNQTSTVYQIITSNLSMRATILFVESKTADPGEEPFTRWWGWINS